jgi:hypothetical protein
VLINSFAFSNLSFILPPFPPERELRRFLFPLDSDDKFAPVDGDFQILDAALCFYIRFRHAERVFDQVFDLVGCYFWFHLNLKSSS